jgi:hypothetical protein
MPSSVAATRTSLYTALKALETTTLEGVHVARTGLWKDIPKRETIAVGMPPSKNYDFPGAGATYFKESYTIPVYILAVSGAGDMQVVEDRLAALEAVTQQTVIANHQLGGSLIYMLPAGGEDIDSWSEGTRNLAVMTLNVECLASVNLAT